MPTSSLDARHRSRVRPARPFRQPAISLPGLIALALACVTLLVDGSPVTAAHAPTASSHSIVKAVQATCATMIGGVVWHDVDSDGVNDGTSEPGINAVELEAYIDDGDSQFEPGGDDTFFASATTAPDQFWQAFGGLYQFNAQPPSSCLPQGLWLDVSAANFATGGPLEDMVLTSGPTYGQSPMLMLLGDDGGGQGANFGYNIVGTYAISSPANPPPRATAQVVTVSFEIKNTGQTLITALPLKTSYNTDYLAFNDASPAPDDGSNDGTINWSDLLAAPSSPASARAAAGGLAPGASITVDLSFVGVRDTTELPGGVTPVTVTSEGALADPDGPDRPVGPTGPLPVHPASVEVAVLNPTAVPLARAWAMIGPRFNKLTWETTDETEVLGFNVLRQDATGAYAPANGQLIMAKKAGLPAAASYSYVDAGTRSLSGTGYLLEIVRLDGRTERQGFAMRVPVKGGSGG